MICDVAVVGGGPAGLAAAVYAASEGLCTTSRRRGWRQEDSRRSSKIENYLGFPRNQRQQLATSRTSAALKFGRTLCDFREKL